MVFDGYGISSWSRHSHWMTGSYFLASNWGSESAHCQVTSMHPWLYQRTWQCGKEKQSGRWCPNRALNHRCSRPAGILTANHHHGCSFSSFFFFVFVFLLTFVDSKTLLLNTRWMWSVGAVSSMVSPWTFFCSIWMWPVSFQCSSIPQIRRTWLYFTRFKPTERHTVLSVASRSSSFHWAMRISHSRVRY